MADRNRLHPLRVCAVMAALLVPMGVQAGPAVDIKEMRKTLRVVTSTPSAGAADVAGLLADLGLGAVAEEAAPQKPLGLGLGLGNIAPSAAPAAVPVPAPTTVTSSFGGTVFGAPQMAPADTPAPRPVPTAVASTTLGGAGGLFAMQAAQNAAPTTAPGLGVNTAPVDVSTGNFRLMLATLAQTYGGINNQLLVNAQGDRGAQALQVRAGTVTLADLQSFSAANGMPPRQDGTLTAPVVLWPGATLRLGQGERLAMARDTGAFLMSMGTIHAKGALIEATGNENPAEPTFAPFVTVLSGGSLHLEGTTLRGLGFGRSLKFAGLTVAGNPMIPTDQKITIRDTFFDQIKTVSIAGARDVEITGNTFHDAGSAALNISGAAHATVRENLFRGAAPTNAIRIGAGSDHTQIAQNVFLEGSRVAILIDGGSNHVAVKENVIWNRDGAGIKFLGARCGRAQGNILIDNAQKGIEVRKSDGTVVQDNVLAGNQSAGIWVSAQARDARTTVRGNRFVGNGAGLSAATGAEIWLTGNDFQRQLPKILDGDIARLTNALVRDLSGQTSMRFLRGSFDTHADVAPLCGNDT